MATTIIALIYQALTFFQSGKLLLGTIATILLILTGFIILEAIGIVKRKNAVRS